MLRTDQLHRVIDVFDNLCVVHARQLALLDVFPRDAVAFNKLAPFFAAAALLDLGGNRLRNLRVLVGVHEFLTEKADVVVDLDDPALCRQILNHLIGHVAPSIAYRSARRVRSDQRSLAHR